MATKLEELKAAIDAARDDAWAAAWYADEAACDAYEVAEAAEDAAWDAYCAELKKIQEEKQND